MEGRKEGAWRVGRRAGNRQLQLAQVRARRNRLLHTHPTLSRVCVYKRVQSISTLARISPSLSFTPSRCLRLARSFTLAAVAGFIHIYTLHISQFAQLLLLPQRRRSTLRTRTCVYVQLLLLGCCCSCGCGSHAGTNHGRSARLLPCAACIAPQARASHNKSQCSYTASERFSSIETASIDWSISIYRISEPNPIISFEN